MRDMRSRRTRQLPPRGRTPTVSSPTSPRQMVRRAQNPVCFSRIARSSQTGLTWRPSPSHREWVLNHARNHIIDTFEAARAARYATYLQYVQTFPYYSLYTYHKGRPPLPPAQVQYLRDQIWSADENLRLGVDTDWRNACLLYPETLDYYFRMVEIVFPKEKEELLRLDGGGGKKKGRRDSAVGDKGKRRS